MIAGIDGCKAGWVAAVEDGTGTVELEVFPSFDSLLHSKIELMVIDVPIGLPHTPRGADQAARDLLQKRACCVFSAPYRPMLAASDYTEAGDIRERIDGKRCTQQAFAIFPKIKQVDSRITPQLQTRVMEGHPEVTFALMQNGTPMSDAKKTATGKSHRIRALCSAFPDIANVAAARRPAGVASDDVLDAFAMLWTARRAVSKSTVKLPSREQYDDRGLRAEIVA